MATSTTPNRRRKRSELAVDLRILSACAPLAPSLARSRTRARESDMAAAPAPAPAWPAVPSVAGAAQLLPATFADGRDPSLLAQKLRVAENALEEERRLISRERRLHAERLDFAEGEASAARARLAQALSSLRLQHGEQHVAAWHAVDVEAAARRREADVEAAALATRVAALRSEEREESVVLGTVSADARRVAHELRELRAAELEVRSSEARAHVAKAMALQEAECLRQQARGEREARAHLDRQAGESEYRAHVELRRLNADYEARLREDVRFRALQWEVGAESRCEEDLQRRAALCEAKAQGRIEELEESLRAARAGERRAVECENRARIAEEAALREAERLSASERQRVALTCELRSREAAEAAALRESERSAARERDRLARDIERRVRSAEESVMRETERAAVRDRERAALDELQERARERERERDRERESRRREELLRCGSSELKHLTKDLDLAIQRHQDNLDRHARQTADALRSFGLSGRTSSCPSLATPTWGSSSSQRHRSHSPLAAGAAGGASATGELKSRGVSPSLSHGPAALASSSASAVAATTAGGTPLPSSTLKSCRSAPASSFSLALQSAQPDGLTSRLGTTSLSQLIGRTPLRPRTLWR
eukprot:TRINITY_DN8902_c0_g2_i2.p2 TRINITY_DN8902_c0_g2~~TRINITY_DN8902_c0_g2_i2.p2  ORF type:complete len:613 (+),score=142.57 TRINITY_DN8902_c0_g2_i2:1630-3468(+)